MRSFGSLLLLGLLFSACGGPGGSGGRERPVDRATAEGILLRGNGNDPDTLDPHLATTVNAGNILHNLFEGLTRFHPVSLKPEPAMAERWEVSADGLMVTFHLREARWSNGDPVTADDFVFAWRRMLHPALAANAAYMLFDLEHAREIHEGTMPDTALGVTAVDARTLRLHLVRPVPYLPSLLAHWAWYPLHEASLRALGAERDRTVLWTLPETMVVNGPFTLTAWQPGRDLRIEKNPLYWEADTVALQGAVFIPFADVETEERAFRGGEIHLTYGFPLGRLRHYREEQPEVLRVDPYLQSNGWLVNLERPGLSDVRVRRAMAMAVDREVINRVVLGDLRGPAFSFVPPGRPLIREDVAAARRLLAEAGYPDGEGLPEFEVLIHTARDWVRVAEVLQEQWAQIGVRVQINSMERSSYFARRSARRFDLCFLGWVGDYPEPETFLDLFRSDAGNNFTGWADEAYDRLLDAAALPGAERDGLLNEAEDLLMQAMPVIPIAFGSTQYLLDPRVQNWHANLLNHHPLRVVRLGSAEVETP